jgi:hypothetical protein
LVTAGLVHEHEPRAQQCRCRKLWNVPQAGADRFVITLSGRANCIC